MEELKRKVEGSEEWIKHIKTSGSTDAQRMFSSESYYMSLWENAPHGMALISEEGDVIDANNAFCELLGIEYDQALGLNLSDFVADGAFREDRRMIETMVRGAMYSGMTEERWNYRLNPNGPFIPVRLIATRIPATLSRPFRHIIIQIYDLRNLRYNINGADYGNKSWMEILKNITVNHFGKILIILGLLFMFLALNGKLGDTIDKIIEKSDDKHYRTERIIEKETPHTSHSSPPSTVN